MESSGPLISLIVPVFDEAPLIDDFLRGVRVFRGPLEIIVVDGGSCDDTAALANRRADAVISAPKGRASQMNAGAAIARGEILWFLHVDLIPPADSIEKITQALTDPTAVGGCFSLRYPRAEWIYRVSDRLGNIGVRLFGFALGDHGIFCRRSAFFRIGGYRNVPILEDAELYRGLSKVGKMKQLHETIVSDPRTFEKWGRFRTTAVYFLILVLYVAGVPISRLNGIYRRFHRLPLSGSDARRAPRAPPAPRSQVALGNELAREVTLR